MLRSTLASLSRLAMILTSHMGSRLEVSLCS